MKVAAYLSVLLGAVYVVALPAMGENPDEERLCKVKCKNDHKEMVEYCGTLKGGRRTCFELAEIAGSPEGQKKCVEICVRLGQGSGQGPTDF